MWNYVNKGKDCFIMDEDISSSWTHCHFTEVKDVRFKLDITGNFYRNGDVK